jgi:prepilin-type processing-associated H-X9-DG protein
MRRRKFRYRPALLFIVLLILVDPLAMLIAYLLPSVQAAREAARRMACTENLSRIGVAMATYHQVYQSYPPAYVADKDGTPMHSWRVLILPFLGEDALYAEYRFDEPWDSPHNQSLTFRMPIVYHCPTSAAGPGLTNYATIVGPHAFGNGRSPRTLSDLKDGSKNTIIVAECAGAGINWLEPRDLLTDDIKRINGDAPMSRNAHPSITSDHPGGAHVLFGDGAVGFLDQNVPPDTLKAILSIDGDEAIGTRDTSAGRVTIVKPHGNH